MLRDAARIGVSPPQFWKMTPKELHYLLEGYLWRRDDRGTMLANFTAAIVSPHTKRRVKASDLYKPVLQEIGKSSAPLTLEERRQRFDKAVKKMGPQTIPVRAG